MLHSNLLKKVKQNRLKIKKEFSNQLLIYGEIIDAKDVMTSSDNIIFLSKSLLRNSPSLTPKSVPMITTGEKARPVKKNISKLDPKL